MVIEHLVDTRELEPPQPMQVALNAVRELRPGACVVMLHRREPFPLYPMLEELGCAHRTTRDEGAPFRVVIWRRDDAAADAHCGPADPLPDGSTDEGCRS